MFAHDGKVFKVEFVRFDHGKAIFAIDAPQSIRVFREEIWEDLKDSPELAEIANHDGNTM